MPNHIQHAVEFLRRNGYEIVERDAKPCPCDRRVSIDIVAWERQSDTMVFFEVSTHAKVARRIRTISPARRRLRQRAKLWWCRINKWNGSCRFDCIDIYGDKDCEHPVIDHVRNVRTIK